MIKKFLIAICFVFLFATSAQAALIDNLVSYWELNDTNDTDAVDVHSTNHGTQEGTTDEAEGKIGTAFSFDGGDDYVDLGDSDDWDISDNITISAWIRGSSLDVRQEIVRKMGQYSMAVSPGTSRKLAVYLWGPGSWFETDISLNDNTWYHVAFTYDRTNLKIYINGDVKIYSETTALATGSVCPLVIGVAGGGDCIMDTSFFNGQIDEVGIWARALPADEIKDSYNQGHGLAYPFDGIQRGVISHWKLDDNLDTNVVLDAHNDNDGTVVGTPNNYSSELSTVDAKIVRAFDLDGNDYVETNYYPDVRQPVSVMMWYKKTALAGYIFGSHDGTNRLYVGDQYIGAGNSFSQTHSLPVNGWHQVIFVLTGTHAYYYVDGVLDDDFAYTASAAQTLTLHLGQRSHSLTRDPIAGPIDEATIWNRAIAQDEITALYNGGDGLAYPFEEEEVPPVEAGQVIWINTF